MRRSRLLYCGTRPPTPTQDAPPTTTIPRNETMHTFRDLTTGRFPAYSSHGCYPLGYLMADGETVCPACLNDAEGFDNYTEHDAPDRDWHIVSQFAHFEGDPLICAHCNETTESAYGVAP